MQTAQAGRILLTSVVIGHDHLNPVTGVEDELVWHGWLKDAGDNIDFTLVTWVTERSVDAVIRWLIAKRRGSRGSSHRVHRLTGSSSGRKRKRDVLRSCSRNNAFSRVSGSTVAVESRSQSVILVRRELGAAGVEVVLRVRHHGCAGTHRAPVGIRGEGLHRCVRVLLHAGHGRRVLRYAIASSYAVRVAVAEVREAVLRVVVPWREGRRDECTRLDGGEVASAVSTEECRVRGRREAVEVVVVAIRRAIKGEGAVPSHARRVLLFADVGKLLLSVAVAVAVVSARGQILIAVYVLIIASRLALSERACTKAGSTSRVVTAMVEYGSILCLSLLLLSVAKPEERGDGQEDEDTDDGSCNGAGVGSSSILVGLIGSVGVVCDA